MDIDSANEQENLPLGRQLPRAKPVTLTFYDSLQDYPYTTTFYVSNTASAEEIDELIRCIQDVSNCVLGKYKIGYEQFIVPGYWERTQALPGGTMGTFKWQISYYAPNMASRSHTIPGRSHETSLRMTKNIMKRAGKVPDLEHPKWQAFLNIFRKICLTKEGEPIHEPITADISDSNWPPKGARKKRR